MILMFHDWNPVSNEEYDISGTEYCDLIEICCRYSSTVSFIIKNKDEPVCLLLEKFRIEKPKNINYHFKNYGLGELTNEEIGVLYYRVCPELNELMINDCDSFFEWINGWGYNNPEDPTFYREDGSVFLTSTIHEGEIKLTANEKEDVSLFVNDERWIKNAE